MTRIFIDRAALAKIRSSEAAQVRAVVVEKDGIETKCRSATIQCSCGREIAYVVTEQDAARPNPFTSAWVEVVGDVVDMSDRIGDKNSVIPKGEEVIHG